MPVRRFKRYHSRIAAHRAQKQLDASEVIGMPRLPASSEQSNELQRMRNRIMRVISPNAGKRIIKI